MLMAVKDSFRDTTSDFDFDISGFTNDMYKFYFKKYDWLFELTPYNNKAPCQLYYCLYQATFNRCVFMGRVQVLVCQYSSDHQHKPQCIYRVQHRVAAQ